MNLENLRSERGLACKVRFWNLAHCTAEVIWIDFHGKQQLYTCLEHAQYLDVNTFQRHYWIFKNKQAGSYLLANRNKYFCATNKIVDRQRHVVILSNFNLPTLKTISINYIARFMRGNCMYVKYLEIPRTLKRDILKKIHKVFNIHRSIDDTKKCETNLDPDANTMIVCETDLNPA